MGKVTIQQETTKQPITLMGKEAGVCWGANIDVPQKNYNRGIKCLEDNHGRVAEYPQVYMVLDGYSARVIREFYTHIGGAPTRLQASTRYINYESGFDYVTPHSIESNKDAEDHYRRGMNTIKYSLYQMEKAGVPREDCAMLLPLGMATRIVVRTNTRNLIDMSHQRMCSRAYWEFRELMNDMCQELSEYSDEWDYIVKNYFKPKCELYGHCTERKACGRKPKGNKH